MLMSGKLYILEFADHNMLDVQVDQEVLLSNQPGA